MLKKATIALFFWLCQTPIFALNVTVGASGADYTTDGTNDEVEIQAAINAVNTAGGGTVTLQTGTFNIQSTYILPKSNVTLSGTSQSGTILSSTRAYSFLIWTNNTAVSRFSLENMTITALNSDHASGVALEKVSNCRISNVKFTGVTCGGWEMIVGIDGMAAATDDVFSRDILIENCLFDGHQGSLEMLLLFNTKHCNVKNCVFQNKTKGCPNDGNGPVVGLWQKTDSISILNCTFLNNESREAIYHSNTCDNTLIENCTFTNTGGVRGANESDWGTFGVDFEKRLILRGCTMTAGANDYAETAVLLGAIEGVLIKDCNITGYEEGMVIQSGLAASLPSGAKHFAVVRTNIRNGNPANNYHALHAGILFQKAVGKMHGFFVCGDISSSLSPPKQEQAVAFTSYPTPIVFDSLFWLGTTITSYNTRPDFAFLDYATQGSPFVVEKCNGGSPPSYCSDCATMTDATIEAKIRTYDQVAANIVHNLLAYQPADVVLSLELLDFSGYTEGGDNVLKWQTANEINNKGFQIERLKEDNSWEILCFVDAKNTAATYYFRDKTPLSISHYRLRQTDYDGKETRSKLISLFRKASKKLKFYPNPVSNTLTIETENMGIIQVFNLLGQPVLTVAASTTSEKLQTSVRLIDVSALPQGAYFLKIGEEQVRFVKP